MEVPDGGQQYIVEYVASPEGRLDTESTDFIGVRPLRETIFDATRSVRDTILGMPAIGLDSQSPTAAFVLTAAVFAAFAALVVSCGGAASLTLKSPIADR